MLDNLRHRRDILSPVHELDELLIRDRLVPPDVKTRVVYHYTSANGLIGILSAGTIRGTNAAFLNDTSEIEYGLSVCVAILEEERSSRTSTSEQVMLERVLGLIRDDASPHEVYVTSFSARCDVLSQWRGYGSADGRFCIGFELAQFSERDILRLPQRVEYMANDQRELVSVRLASPVTRRSRTRTISDTHGVALRRSHFTCAD